MRGARLNGRVSLIFGRVSNLDLSGSKLAQMDLSGSHIEGELGLGSALQPAPVWVKGTRLVLRNAHAGALQDRDDAWEGLELQLDGFTYDRLGGFGAGADPDMPLRDVDWYANGENGWLDRDPSYSPQPYEQLAAVFRAAGEPVKAEAVLYERRERERALAWERGEYNRWFGLSLLKLTIGYGLGLRYFRALWWLLGFTLWGSIVLLVSGQGPIGACRKAFFSLDRLVPRLVQLDKSHDKDEARLTGAVRYYFYLHKVIGYLLASFLLAGLAGLTQS